jgi:cell division protein ZapA
MAQVSVTINGRGYDISCDDGQETHLFHLAEEVDRRVASLVASVGQIGDARLLLLASLLLADQIEDLKNEVALFRADSLARSALGSEAAVVDGGALGEELRGLAERIEAMAQRMATEAQLPRRLDPPR